MKDLSKKIALLCILIAATTSSFAQCKEWKWPADTVKAREKLVLLQDAVKAKQYDQAKSPLHWLITKAPNLNIGLYIWGAEIYDELAKKEKDQALKKVYIDSLMLIYDMRIANCGEMANVLYRKAMTYFRYNINGPAPSTILTIMDQLVDVAKDKVPDAVLVPYMQTVAMAQQKEKKFSEEEIIQKYDKISQILDTKIKQAGVGSDKGKKLAQSKQDVDNLLLKLVNVDCDFVKKNMEPVFHKNPSDTLLAKRIFGLMLAGKCTSDPLWLETGEVVFNSTKDYGLGKNLGIQFMAAGNNEKAGEYFTKTAEIAKSKEEQAEAHWYLGALHSKNGERVKARDEFRKALSIDPNYKQAYESIGDLYFNSFNDCAKKVSMADDRLVYLIAYDYYQKAGNAEKMKNAKSAFPSKEEIFLVNYKSGDTKTVGCWINESTVIRTRD
jgi:tetratricopeptide (TPR) repeat protein